MPKSHTTGRRPARQENGSCKQTIFHTNKLTWFFKSFEGHSSRFVQRHFRFSEYIAVEMYVVTSGKISLKSVLQTSVKCQIKPIKRAKQTIVSNYNFHVVFILVFGCSSLEFLNQANDPLLQNKRYIYTDIFNFLCFISIKKNQMN